MSEMDKEQKEEKTIIAALSKRSILSQILACLAQNLLLLDLGMAISFSTIIIPALLGAKGPMSFSEEQASWFGSICFIVQPIGSILSGITLEPLGRKKALLLANFPHVIAWLMIYFSHDIVTVFTANVLLGLGTGFMETPILTYIGEVSHPKVRGTLSTISQVFTSSGIFFAYLLGSIVDWRTAALISLSIPTITVIAIIPIPETPVWLISKGRMDDALNALCWIRGWAKAKDVQEEFDELVIYQKNSVQCRYCTDSDVNACPHTTIGVFDKIKYAYKNMTRKEILRPLLLVMFMFSCSNTTVTNPIKPNMVNVYKCFGFNVDAYLAVVVTGSIGIVTVFFMLFIIRILGKRFLCIFSLALCTICTFLIGLYAAIFLPEGLSSYAAIEFHEYEYSWIAVTLFFILNVAMNMGSAFVPWIMLSEIFPLSGRGMACGLSAAFAYVGNSITSKTYYNLETGLGIHGAFYFYGVCNVIGVVALYFILPETEGKSFEEIEKYFSNYEEFIKKKWDNLFKFTKTNRTFVADVNIATVDGELELYRTIESEKVTSQQSERY